MEENCCNPQCRYYHMEYDDENCPCKKCRGTEVPFAEAYLAKPFLFEPITIPNDAVNHPPHYETGKFECIDVMVETQGAETVKAYCLCAAFKYLYRHSRKNGVEDIRKANWYLNKYLELEGATDDKT